MVVTREKWANKIFLIVDVITGRAAVHQLAQILYSSAAADDSRYSNEASGGGARLELQWTCFLNSESSRWRLSLVIHFTGAIYLHGAFLHQYVLTHQTITFSLYT